MFCGPDLLIGSFLVRVSVESCVFGVFMSLICFSIEGFATNWLLRVGMQRVVNVGCVMGSDAWIVFKCRILCVGQVNL